MLTINNLTLDLRALYYQAGIEYKPTVFIFTDTQVLEDSFLEDINNILSSGEVPNLYKPEEFEEVFICSIYLFVCILILDISWIRNNHDYSNYYMISN